MDHKPTPTSSPPTRPRRPDRARSGCCSSTGSRSWTPSVPGRCSRTGPSSTPRTAGASLCLSADGAPVVGAKNLVLGAHHSIDEAPALDVLIHPGGPGHPADCSATPTTWTGSGSSGPTVPLMASVCTGSLVYAAAGLLAGRPATTHWASLNLLSELDPTVITDVDARFVDDGDLITSAGVSAGIDMALHLVARLAGVERAREVRREIQYDPHPPI